MFQLPLPKKRITWFFSITFIILFLFLYYGSDSIGFGYIQRLYRGGYYASHKTVLKSPNEEIMLKVEIFYPKYYLHSSTIPVYIQVENMTTNLVDNLKIWTIHLPKTAEKNSSIDNTNISSSLLTENNENLKYYNEVIFVDISPYSETIRKINVTNQSDGDIILDFDYLINSNKYKNSTLNSYYIVELNNFKALRSMLLPYLLLPPFSNAIFPIIILFIGYLLETILSDNRKLILNYQKNNNTETSDYISAEIDEEDEIIMLLFYIKRWFYFIILITKNFLYTLYILCFRNKKEKIKKYKISTKIFRKQFFQEYRYEKIKSIFVFIGAYIFLIFEIYLIVIIIFTPLEDIVNFEYPFLSNIILFEISLLLIAFLFTIFISKKYKIVEDKDIATCSLDSSHENYYLQRICPMCGEKFGHLKDLNCMEENCKGEIDKKTFDYCKNCQEKIDKDGNLESGEKISVLRRLIKWII